MELLYRICPKRCTSIEHQSHYTSIVDQNRVKIKSGPKLKGPTTNLQDHSYRMCQYLEIQGHNSAAKPIQVFNVHCPASKKHPYGSHVRKDVAEWLQKNTRGPAVIGGDINHSVFSLKEHFKTENVNGVVDTTSPYNILHEEYKKHGDIAITKDMPEALSMPSKVNETSIDHFMVTVLCPLPHSPKKKNAPSTQCC